MTNKSKQDNLWGWWCSCRDPKETLCTVKYLPDNKSTLLVPKLKTTVKDSSCTTDYHDINRNDWENMPASSEIPITDVINKQGSKCVTEYNVWTWTVPSLYECMCVLYCYEIPIYKAKVN